MCASVSSEDASLTPENIGVESRRRWLKNSEIVEVLSNPKRFGLRARSVPPSVPQSGDIFVFDKQHVRSWRRDGHLWKKKKDGKNVMEHHEKLKVRGVEMINCCYAHHDTIDGFHRRCYWLLASPRIVLVHYRHQQRTRVGTVSFDDSRIFMGNDSRTLESSPALQSLPISSGVLSVPLFDDSPDELPPHTPKSVYAKSAHHIRSLRQSPYSPGSGGYSPVSGGYSPVSGGYSPINAGYSSVSTGYSPVLSGSSEGSDARCCASSRKERKAHFAKLSRERKKAHVHELEWKVRRLSLQIDNLESQVRSEFDRIGEGAPSLPLAVQQKNAIDAIMPQCCDNLRQILPYNDNPGSTSDVKTELSTLFSSMYMRNSLAIDLMKMAKSSYYPGDQESFALWGLDQLDSMTSGTCSSPAQVRRLWLSMLQKELGLSHKQCQELQQCRKAARDLREQQEILDNEFDGVVQDMVIYSEHLDTVMSNFVRILEPTQLAKYFCWIEQRARHTAKDART